MCCHFLIIINFFCCCFWQCISYSKRPRVPRGSFVLGRSVLSYFQYTLLNMMNVSARLFLEGCRVSWEWISINVCYSVTKLNILIYILKTGVILKILTWNQTSRVFNQCRGRVCICYKLPQNMSVGCFPCSCYFDSFIFYLFFFFMECFQQRKDRE